MSSWTHVNGVVQVSAPGRTQPEARYIVDTILEHLPLVTGSERDMAIHVVQLSRENSASSCDEFGNSTNLAKTDYGDHDRKRGWYRMQSDYNLVIEGNFRDRSFDTTKKELMNWLSRLAKRLRVESVIIRMWDSYGKKLIFDNDEALYNMYEYPSWVNKDHEPCWWHALRSPISLHQAIQSHPDLLRRQPQTVIP